MQRLKQTFFLLLGLVSMISSWYIALRLFRAWWEPMIGDNGMWIKYGIGIMVMEFIVVHSGGLLIGASTSVETKTTRKVFMLCAVLFYFGAAWLISSVFGNNDLFYSFSTIMFCRMISGFFSLSGNNVDSIKHRSVMSALLYLLVVLLSVLIPFPQGGLTDRVLSNFHYGTGEGLWNREPQRALAAGMIYFFFMGVYELYSARDDLQKSAARAKAEAEFYGK